MLYQSYVGLHLAGSFSQTGTNINKLPRQHVHVTGCSPDPVAHAHMLPAKSILSHAVSLENKVTRLCIICYCFIIFIYYCLTCMSNQWCQGWSKRTNVIWLLTLLLLSTKSKTQTKSIAWCCANLRFQIYHNMLCKTIGSMHFIITKNCIPIFFTYYLVFDY